MKNGFKTYSKTSFKEDLHKRNPGGTFEKKHVTEEDKVEYHHDFSSKSHPRKEDGSFVSNYASSSIVIKDSEGLKNGKERYGSSA